MNVKRKPEIISFYFLPTSTSDSRYIPCLFAWLLRSGVYVRTACKCGFVLAYSCAVLLTKSLHCALTATEQRFPLTAQIRPFSRSLQCTHSTQFLASGLEKQVSSWRSHTFLVRLSVPQYLHSYARVLVAIHQSPLPVQWFKLRCSPERIQFLLDSGVPCPHQFRPLPRQLLHPNASRPSQESLFRAWASFPSAPTACPPWVSSP